MTVNRSIPREWLLVEEGRRIDRSLQLDSMGSSVAGSSVEGKSVDGTDKAGIPLIGWHNGLQGVERRIEVAVAADGWVDRTFLVEVGSQVEEGLGDEAAGYVDAGTP